LPNKQMLSCEPGPCARVQAVYSPCTDSAFVKKSRSPLDVGSEGRNLAMNNYETTSGIILAGGKSSRMGTNKAELLYQGMPLLQWQTEKLRSLGLPEVLVSGEGQNMIPDDFPGKGPLGGLYSTLRSASGKQCLVLPVDVPLITVAALEQLLQAHRGGITLLCLQGRPEPLIGVYDSCLAEAILPILNSEKTAVWRLLDLTGFRTVPFTGDAGTLLNCNTPEEFAAVCAAAHP